MILPQRVFFTGVPGSKWSSIAQTLEQLSEFNISDRTNEREYTHSGFTGHKGVYFGTGMEFESCLDSEYLDSTYSTTIGTQLIKSHDWAYKLDEIAEKFPGDWIMLVYRPDMPSYTWWHEAGGFNIKYPNYQWYNNSVCMMKEIAIQNQNILKFAHEHDLTWNYFTSKWVENNFGITREIKRTWPDILVTLLK
jgi:hypothetical protein